MSENTNTPTNVLIVGVGGQGVIMVSKVLAMLCQNHGYEVKQSEELGNLKAANTVLLGALSTTLEFAVEDWLEVIRAFVPAKSIDINMQAFAAGRQWAESGDKRVDAGAPAPLGKAAPSHPRVRTTLEITESWCKGCDICVKMCPERCLRLNDRLVAELSAPDKCTGCRMCEWLCPDFAIKMTNTPVSEAAL